MCGIGSLFGMRERPPPYEFFVIRVASAAMWFAVSVSLMAVPNVAEQAGIVGHLASVAMAFPLVWVVLFLIAGWSWQRGGGGGRVGLKEMYSSERLVGLI